METESSPRLSKPKTQKNKPTNSLEQRINNEPPSNSVELPGLNTIKVSNKILEWNCWGISANYKKPLLYLNEYNFKVVCLQEIFLKDKNQLNIKHFQSYNRLYKDGHRASGGVSSFVRKDMPQQQINIDRELQLIAVKTKLHKQGKKTKITGKSRNIILFQISRKTKIITGYPKKYHCFWNIKKKVKHNWISQEISLFLKYQEKSQT